MEVDSIFCKLMKNLKYNVGCEQCFKVLKNNSFRIIQHAYLIKISVDVVGSGVWTHYH